MELMLYYSVFAAATTVYALVFLILPVLSDAKVKFSFLQKAIYVTVFSIISLILAPFILPACLNPSVGDRFKFAYLKALTEK